jgi:hypothetical protein
LESPADLQHKSAIPEGEDDLRDPSQNLDAVVGKPISRQKSATISASVFFLLPLTVVHPSSESPSKTCSATLKGMPSTSVSDSLPSEISGEKRDLLPAAAGDAPPETAGAGRGAKVLRCLSMLDTFVPF